MTPAQMLRALRAIEEKLLTLREPKRRFGVESGKVHWQQRSFYR
jgi:hypothetical protein